MPSILSFQLILEAYGTSSLEIRFQHRHFKNVGKYIEPEFIDEVSYTWWH